MGLLALLFISSSVNISNTIQLEMDEIANHLYLDPNNQQDIQQRLFRSKMIALSLGQVL